MKNTMKRTLSFVLAVAMVLSCMTGLSVKAVAAETDTVTVTTDGNSVVIGNGYISREFSTANGKLSTTNITNKRTEGDTVFTPASGSEEFIIRVTKQGSTGAVSHPALDRTGWTATANSRHNASGDSDGPASNLLDGRLESIWHTNYGGGVGPQNYPYNVVITLNGSKTFSCFSYTPRQQGEDTNGNIKGYELWYATAETKLDADAEGWIKVASGDFKYDGVSPIYVNLDETVTATQVKFVATSSKNGQQFAGGAEFNLHADKIAAAANDREFAASALELAGEPVIADTTAVINGENKSGKMITFNFVPYEFKGVTYTISEVIVMYDGDHFMRKYMEISVPEDQKDLATIDFIDLESLNVNASDATWTIPHVGGIVQMSEFKANLGQPFYVQGMFFGCEFPETDTQIENGVGRSRYYTGKNFTRFEADNQLTTDGKYVTWQTVAGAARSTEMQVIQADFYEYIYSIATPSDFRIQYNSWFDNMMLISDENILETFIEFDQELNKVEVRPLDSYVVDDGWINYNDTHVVDAARAGTTLNKSGFWEFNSKFPNELYPSSALANKFGSNFGMWVGPRGGYNFYGSLADIITKAGKGSKAGGSIDVASRVYVKNLTDMFCDFQDRFQVNYWKWDGFADGAQYGAFPAADGVPGYANDHMTGGYQNMYHVTDLWEAWIDLMEAVRANAEENEIPKLWLSLTCYVNPSPWFLQWANSVWMQCTHDQKDANFGLTKMDKQMTYRDSVYYDFLVNHQFQFPLANLYNHDPVYGKEGTGMTKTTATDDNFQNYLYMQSTRGTSFWELYFSDSIMTDGKYEVTGEFLEWAEENSHILRNAKMIGGMPDRTFLENASSNEAYAEAYGYSCFDGTDGIISIRNPHSSQAKTITFTFDRNIGVAEDAGTLDYFLVHNYNMPADGELTGEFTYGETYTFTLQPNEVRMFQISKGGDTTAPVMERAFSNGKNVITVRFNEKVLGNEFTVSGATVESVERSADDVTYRITLAEAPENNAELTITANVTDISGNPCTETISMVYNAGNLVTGSLQTNYGFTVSATVSEISAAALVAQGDAYELGINADGCAYFTVNGATAVSDVQVAVAEDAETATIIGVKENNGILKLYVDGTLAGSAYKAENRYFTVPAAEITVSSLASKAAVYDIAFGYDELDAAEGPASTKIEGITGEGSSTDTSEPAHDKSVGNAFDGDYNTFWATVPGGSLADAYLIADLGGEYTIDKVAYTKRFDSGALYNCTGNLLDYIIEVSTDGETWTEVATGETIDGTTVITFEPVPAAYVRMRATRSYHWQESSANTVMTVAEFEVYEYVVPVMEPDDDSRDIPLSAVEVSTGDYEKNGMQYSEGPAYFAVDDDPNSLWHTDWYGTSRENHWFQFELTENYKVDGLRYWPRQAGNTNGTITKYEIQVSNDGENFRTVASGDWENNRDWKIVQFQGENVKYVRLVSVDAVTDNSYVFASASEIRITGTKVSGEVHQHVWGEWTVTTEPTCTEAGEETRTCECGAAEKREVEALGHDWNEGVCGNCGEEQEQPVESEKLTGVTGQGSSTDTSEAGFDKSVGNAFDGDYSTFWATVEAGTLEEDYLIADLGGEYTINKVAYTKRYHESAGYNCTGNLLDYIIEVSTDGESWTEVATGETDDGTTVIEFEAVQAAYVRLRATRSYHWQEENANKVMTVAELEIFQVIAPEVPQEHSFGEWTVTTPATCTETGIETRTCECGESEEREIPALGHDWHDGVCGNCGEEQPVEPIDPNDPWGKSKWVKVEVDSETIWNSTEGNFEYAWDGRLDTIWHSDWKNGKDVLTGENTISGTIDFTREYVINQFSFTPRQDYTYWENGSGVVLQASLYVKDADDTEWKLVAEHVEFEHNQEKKTIHFEEQAVRYVKFVAEKSSYMDQNEGWVAVAEFDIDLVQVTEHEHEYTAVVTAPTCTEAGYTTYTCSCGDTYVADEVAALGHSAAEAVKENEKAATCTESGSYDLVVYCSVCDAEISRETVTVDALGHTEEILPAVEATCTTDGLTEGKKCAVCDEILVAQAVIPATGHEWKGTGCVNCDAKRENPFTDVPEDSFFIDPVLWAVENGITTGTSETTFDPNGQCMRAVVVTFLWRAAGSPEPTSSENPFKDVTEADFFYKAVLWAVEKGITNGLTADTFGPTALCNRAQVVTFLYRAMGKPEVTSSEHPFTDIVEGEFYYDAMLWAVQNGITSGMTPTTFAPNTVCNRAQVVTFLYRANSK